MHCTAHCTHVFLHTRWWSMPNQLLDKWKQMQLWESSSFWTSFVINKKNSQLFNGVGWGGSSKVQVSHLPLFRVWKPNFKPQKKSFGIFDTFSYYLLLTTITINYLFLFYPSSPAFAIFLDTKRNGGVMYKKLFTATAHKKKLSIPCFQSAALFVFILPYFTCWKCWNHLCPSVCLLLALLPSPLSTPQSSNIIQLQNFETLVYTVRACPPIDEAVVSFFRSFKQISRSKPNHKSSCK